MSRPADLRATTSNPAHLAAVTVRWASEVSRIAERTVGPLLDLFIRPWLAEIFWASSMVKLQSWTTALYLSAHEYPVSWLDPVTAAWLGKTIEIVCPPSYHRLSPKMASCHATAISPSKISSP
jgi:hypothetical protein